MTWKRLIWENFIFLQNNHRGERASIDQKEMLDIIETSAWVPKKKPDKEKLYAVDSGFLKYSK